MRNFASVLLLAAVMAVPVLSTGCSAQVRVYDPYYHDYHAWAGETTYYAQWETNTHRDHQDFNKRNDADNRILECAVAGRADLIVTGDRDLLELKQFEGTRIVSLRSYLEMK